MIKYPSVKVTLQLVREMGLVGYYDSEYSEFCINYPLRHPMRQSDGYFTNSRIDALLTARTMQRMDV